MSVGGKVCNPEMYLGDNTPTCYMYSSASYMYSRRRGIKKAIKYCNISIPPKKMVSHFAEKNQLGYTNLLWF